jgi:hypothetical protein
MGTRPLSRRTQGIETRRERRPVNRFDLEYVGETRAERDGRVKGIGVGLARAIANLAEKIVKNLGRGKAL